MIAIDDVLRKLLTIERVRLMVEGRSYVVPIATAWLERGATEAKGALPLPGLRGVLGQGELTSVIIP